MNHVNVKGVDNINACYGGTKVLLNSLSWCRETGGYIVVRYSTVVAPTTDSSFPAEDMYLRDSSY